MYKSFKSNTKGITNISLLIGLVVVVLFGAIAYKASDLNTELYRGFINFDPPPCECSGGNDCGECGGDCHGGCATIFGIEYECGGSSGNYACEVACDCDGDCGDCGGTCSGSCPDFGNFEQSCDATGLGTYICNPIEDIVDEIEEAASCDCSGACGDCLGTCYGTCPDVAGFEQVCDPTGLGTHICNPIEDVVETVQSELEQARDAALDAAEEWCNATPETMAVCDAVSSAGDAIVSIGNADPDEWCDSHENREATCDTEEGKVVAIWCGLNDFNWEICETIETGVNEALPEALSVIGWGGIESNTDAVQALNSGWCSISPETRALCDQVALVGVGVGHQIVQEMLGIPVSQAATAYVPSCPEPGSPSSPNEIGIKITKVGNDLTQRFNQRISNLGLQRIDQRVANQALLSNIGSSSSASTFQIHFVKNVTSEEIAGDFNIIECLTLNSHGRGVISNVQAKEGYVEFEYDCGTSEDADDLARVISAEYKVTQGGQFVQPNTDDLDLTCQSLAKPPLRGELSISDKQIKAVIDFMRETKPELRSLGGPLPVPGLDFEFFKPFIDEQVQIFQKDVQGIPGLENIELINPERVPLEELIRQEELAVPQLELLDGVIQLEGIAQPGETTTTTPQIELDNVQLEGIMQMEGVAQPQDTTTGAPQLEIIELEGATNFVIPQAEEAVEVESAPSLNQQFVPTTNRFNFGF